MSDWFSFYAATATASAALLGLLFVAVSVAAPSALNDRRSPIRSLAEQAFQNYLLVLTLSCFVLFPRVDLTTLGAGFLAMTGSRSIWALFRLRTIVMRAGSWRAALPPLRRQIASLIGLGCLLVASTRTVSGSATDLHLLAAGALVLLASSAVASWELLLRLVPADHADADIGD